jgi:hypothetical protein
MWDTSPHFTCELTSLIRFDQFQSELRDPSVGLGGRGVVGILGRSLSGFLGIFALVTMNDFLFKHLFRFLGHLDIR